MPLALEGFCVLIAHYRTEFSATPVIPAATGVHSYRPAGERPKARHSGESRNPALFSGVIPAQAGIHFDFDPLVLVGNFETKKSKELDSGFRRNDGEKKTLESCSCRNDKGTRAQRTRPPGAPRDL
jgi:hypothetical protein